MAAAVLRMKTEITTIYHPRLPLEVASIQQILEFQNSYHLHQTGSVCALVWVGGQIPGTSFSAIFPST